jgi:hypothetical protein
LTIVRPAGAAAAVPLVAVRLTANALAEASSRVMILRHRVFRFMDFPPSRYGSVAARGGSRRVRYPEIPRAAGSPDAVPFGEMVTSPAGR